MIIRKNKLNAKKVTYEGLVFDSKKEYFRYLELKSWLKEGKIKDLKVKPRYTFELNDVKLGWYTPDFEYSIKSDVPDFWDFVVEDIKGWKGGDSYARFRRQCKMMKAFYGIEVKEV